MAINKKLFWANLKETFKKVGTSSKAVLSGLDKADKEMNKKLKEIMSKSSL